MKKKVILFAGLLAGFSLSAQKESSLQDPNRKSAERFIGEKPVIRQASQSLKGKNNAQVLYSWDFASGLPSDWTNIGTPASASWEYRGPSTTPDVTVGSRGAYTTEVPITSPTASNGFMIFDSDYLDNGGDETNMGGGPAPTPHMGVLTTGTIDLSQDTLVELEIYSYVRAFLAECKVAFSTDDGLTYPDTVQVFELDVNDQSSTSGREAIDVSAYIGGEATAKMKFIYDGTILNANGDGGYYFWMLDDVSLSVLPKHELRFSKYTFIPDGGTEESSAPAHDMIFNADSEGSSDLKTGYMNVNEIVPIHFDANILNYGSETQTNVDFEVNIYNNANGSIVTTLTGSSPLDLGYGEMGDFETFYTPQWTPPGTGTYNIVYTVTSDSIPGASGAVQPRDSFRLVVHQRLSSLDFGSYDNSIGTTNLGDDESAVGSMLHFSNGTATDSNAINVNSISVALGSATGAGAELVFEAWDTTGFSYTEGFNSQNPYFSKSFILDAEDAGQVTEFDLTDETTGLPPQLPAPGTYFFTVKMYSVQGQFPVYIGNDQTFEQPSFLGTGGIGVSASIMYSIDDGRWYSGYLDSRSFNSPLIRVNTEPARMFSLGDNNTAKFSVYPNPSNGSNIKIAFEKEGDYTVKVMNAAGQEVYSDIAEVQDNSTYTFDIANAPKGVYILTVSNGKKSVSTKLSVQ